MSGESLKKFGKYFLLDLIAQGGMAEIYRARLATDDGGGRLIAIKRILANYSQSAEFVTMFKSEIKTLSSLTHPNIVQLYDFGDENGLFFIAMEYVDGKNLRQFISRFQDKKSGLPVELSAYIIEQAAMALYYAHSYKDKFTGAGLNIVHRDISPQNILISFDGSVKVIDFGIAKAVTNVEHTRAGVIKGKPSYLSPEQIAGEVLDGRSDIFALGGVLWELLAGKKLFTSDNDFNVLKMIENCNSHIKPPSSINPKVPKELDAIVMRCLTQDRDQRFSNAEELQRALHKFLYNNYAEFNPSDLGYFARELFKNEIVEDRKLLTRLNDKAILLLSANTNESPKSDLTSKTVPLQKIDREDTLALTKPTNTDQIPPPNKEKTGSFREFELTKEKTSITLEFSRQPLGASSNANEKRGDFAATGNTRTMRSLKGPVAQEKKSKTTSFISAAAVMAALLIGYTYFFNTSDTDPKRDLATTKNQTQLEIKSNVKAATVSVNGKVLASELPANLSGLKEGSPLQIKVSSNGYRVFTKEIILEAGKSESLFADLKREDSSQPPAQEGNGPKATLVFGVSPAGLGTQIYVNGKEVDVSGVIQVSSNSTVDVVVEREGFRTFRDSVFIDSSKLESTGEFALNIELKPAKFGYISIKTTPSAEAWLVIDGIEEKWRTPVSRKRIPIGKYKVKLVNTLLGMEKEMNVEVEEDRFANIEERLNLKEETERLPSSQ